MRRLIVLFVVLLYSSFLFSQQTQLQIVAERDTTFHQLIYKSLDSVSTQKLVAYFKNNPSQKAIEKQFFLGKQSGKQLTYYPDGTLYEVSVFQNGRKNGDYSRFNEVGSLIIKAKYSEGKLFGFYIDKQKNFQGKYLNGKRNGKWEFNTDSPNYEKRFYKKGKQVEKRQVIPEGILKRTKQVEHNVEPIKNAQEDSILVPINGNVTWFKLSYVSRESLKHPAMRKAFFVEYPQQVALTKYVYNGYVNGMYKIYYPNGKLYQFKNYTASLLDGEIFQYNESGKLELKGKYLDGKKIGVWKYYEDSQLVKKEIFRSGVLKKTKSNSK